MKQIFDKNTLLFYFEPFDFPADVLSKDALKDKALLFNEIGTEPLLMNKSFKREIEGKGAYLPAYRREKPKARKVRMPSEIKPKDTEEDVNRFFDNFEGKKGESKVIYDNINLKSSLSINNGIGLITKQEKPPETIKKEISISLEAIFGDTSSLKEQIKDSTGALDDSALSKDSKVVNIKRIYGVNECLNYQPKDFLWYIYHKMGKSSFGPLSSLCIEEMYNKQILNGESDIRFIDLFTLKHQEPFQYFKLKDIEKSDFIEQITPSPKAFEAINLNIKRLKPAK